MATPYYAGMDIGGTSARIRIISPEGTLLHEATGTGATLNVDEDAFIENAYRKVVFSALENAGLVPADCLGLGIGASGVDTPELQQKGLRIFKSMGFPPANIAIVNDCEVLLAHADGPAIVVVAGTGSIATASGPNGEVVRVGGWSHILSDEGSGFYIAMRLLRAMGDHFDGRIHAPGLFSLFTEATGIEDLFTLHDFIRENINDKTVFARLAPLVEAAYNAGDETAEAILEDAAQQVFALVRDVYRKLGPDAGPVPVFLWGSVLLKNEPVRSRVAALIQSELGCSATVPTGDALDAALKLARKQNTSK